MQEQGPIEVVLGQPRLLFSITNGPRQVVPLKEMGHKHVVVEIDLHPRTLGVIHIVESEFGATLRELAKDA